MKPFSLGALENGEAEGDHHSQGEDEGHPGDGHGVPDRSGVEQRPEARGQMPLRLRERAPRHQKGDERKTRREQARRRLSQVVVGQSADGGTQGEADAESRPDERHLLAAILVAGDIGDVGLRRPDGRAEDPGCDARDQEHGVAVCEREKQIGEDRAEEAEHEQRPAAVAVRQAPPERSAKKLHRRKGGEEQADLGAVGPVDLGVARQEREDDAEAEKVDDDRQEENTQSRALHSELSADRAFRPFVNPWGERRV
jgi:hypothetical protein